MTPANAPAAKEVLSRRTGSPPEVRVSAYALSDVGIVREHNEDAFLMADLTHANLEWPHAHAQAVGPGGVLFVVCDGMGGAAAGEVASELATDCLYEHMLRTSADQDADDVSEHSNRLSDAAVAANRRIFEDAVRNRNRRGMGTTLTAALLVRDHLFVAQVGDSRAYILRDGTLTQITRDQSLVNELLESGSLAPEEVDAFEHHNVIMQALGTQASVEAVVTHARVFDGDMILLCSDGLSSALKADQLRHAVGSSASTVDLCRTLIDRANAAGGPDNITVIAAKVEIEARGEQASASPPPVAFERHVALDPAPATLEALMAGDGEGRGPRRDDAMHSADPATPLEEEELREHLQRAPRAATVVLWLVGAAACVVSVIWAAMT